MFSGMFSFFDMADNYESRKVARSEYDWGFISTCNVTDSDKPYETAIKHNDYNDGHIIVVEMYDTRELAEEGHLRWIETMKNPPESLTDNNESVIGKILNDITGQKPTYKKVNLINNKDKFAKDIINEPWEKLSKNG